MALSKITADSIAANAVTANLISNTAIVTALGFTPVNKAGDTMTGAFEGKWQTASVHNDAYTDVFISTAAQTPVDAFPGYGFHKSGTFGTYLYAESHTQLLLRGNNGSVTRIWNSANFPEPLGSGSVTGVFSANTWYTLADCGSIDVGSYLLIARVNTYNAGGGSYNEIYSGIFSQGQTYVNSTQADTVPMVKGGHAPNNEQLSFRYQRRSTSSAIIQWQSTSPLNLNNTDGRAISYKILRLASI